MNKNKKNTEDIIQAIHLSGNLTFKAGFEIKPKDTDKLHDDIKTEI